MIEIMGSNLLDQCPCIISYEVLGPKKDDFVRNVIVATGGQAPFWHTNNEMIIWSWLDIEHYCILLVFFCLIHNPRLWTQTTQPYAAKSHHLRKLWLGGGVSGKAVLSMNQFLPNEAGRSWKLHFCKKLAEATPRRGFKSPETRGAKIMFTTLAINGESPKQAMRSNRYQFL